jgi:hypothetical protein
MSIDDSLMQFWAEHFGEKVPIQEELDKCLHEPDLAQRQIYANGVAGRILSSYGKRHLGRNLENLAAVEFEILQSPLFHLRDHVVHAVLTYLLGLYINSEFMSRKKVDVFQWDLASLLHDIGYPMQFKDSDLRSRYICDVNRIAEDIVRPRKLSDEIDPVRNTQLAVHGDSLALLQECIGSKWKLDIAVHGIHNRMCDADDFSHGTVSALTALSLIDLMYSVHPNWQSFESHVVPACAAIFLHDLKKEDLDGQEIMRSNAALPFLLRLADSLQEWERPGGNRTVYPASDFKIEMKGKELFFYVKSQDCRDRIQDEIGRALGCKRIHIEGWDC